MHGEEYKKFPLPSRHPVTEPSCAQGGHFTERVNFDKTPQVVIKCKLRIGLAQVLIFLKCPLWDGAACIISPHLDGLSARGIIA
jgi:hypothetical protein